ncbi:FAD-binding protein [Chloroflexota bacterium]
MNYIVLLKQVPDIKHIPNEAWDQEKGTLKRGLLENVCNELDKQAMAFALEMRQQQSGKIVVLTMGPPFAEDVLRYALSVGADAGVLLSDRKLGGADTTATAYSLGQAIRKIASDIINDIENYIIVSGMQSVDGDTAQVPPQIAEELGIVHIAYATSGEFGNAGFKVKRITSQGTETVSPDRYPCLVTVTNWTEPPNATFNRTRWAYAQEIYQWSAQDIDADESRIGLTGSRTTVYRIFSPKEMSKKTCVYENDMVKLTEMVKKAYTIKLEAKEEATEEKDSYRLPEGKEPHYHGELWIYAEPENGTIPSSSFELLGKASELAKPLKEKVGALLVGNNIKGAAGELIAYGADKVYIVDNPLLADFLPVPYTKVVSELIEKYRPQMMLFSATPLGRELGPRIAYRTKSGLTADCTGLDIMDFQRGKLDLPAVLRQTRPALGGNIMAAIISQNSTVQMSTARPGVMQALDRDDSRTGEIIEYQPAITKADLGARIMATESREATSGLLEAGAIACGGGGCRTKEQFERYIVPLADSLGSFLGQEAMVGATRTAVELGFIDRSHQIGQTGQTVKPKVYIAVGVSGAVQHLTGMQNSDIIIAINKDAKSPIFKVADFGVVGNMEEVIPELVKALSSEGARL